MPEETQKQNPLSRAILIMSALLLIVLAFIGRRAHFIGFEEVGGMQIALLGLGALLISVALLREGIVRVYQFTAIMLLNTALLLLIVELVVILSFNLQFSLRDTTKVPVAAEVPYFDEQEWGQTMWQEYAEVEALIAYKPYVMWGQAPFDGEFINVDESGHREVPDAACDNPDAYTIFIYGGSTMWGLGVPDWGTIPAYLQSALSEEAERPFCVINYGELAFVSTQETLNLMLETRAGNVPDMVIFYDGVNDTISASNSREAGLPRSVVDFSRAFEEEIPRTGLWGWVNSTYTARFLSALRQKPPETPAPEVSESHAVRTAQLADNILAVYMSNYEQVAYLAETYEFDYLFIWQPTLVIGEKVMTDDEILAASAPPSSLKALYEATWAGAENLANENPNMVYLGGIFDGVESYAYYDHVHLIPEGNQIIGEALAHLVIDKIE